MDSIHLILLRIFRPILDVTCAVACTAYENMGCNCTKEKLVLNSRRFYVQKRLGEGGFSVVDLVEEGPTGKLFACKRIMCHSKSDEKVALEELEYYRRFAHPNLIMLEESGMIPRGDICEVLLVLPFYRRGMLQEALDKLKENGQHYSQTQLLRLFKGICDGVRELHNAKPTAIAHRDIKPHNVMLADDDSPVLMDFGSMAPARLEVVGRSEAIALQDTAGEKCSMLFRAPELFHVESHCVINEKIDIWSLGCTLFNMAYLYSPFEPIYMKGDSIHLAVIGRNFKFPETSEYAPVVNDLISSMLVVEPMERPTIEWVLDQVNNMTAEMENRV
ncbi:serine/threonine-protein kinase 16-like [Anneissia japonica]|uniref:serine/threonine-protein kinase 16-like n=1 Tax=Anneissia japonica TaxID=1529436 RepID=UPI0014259B3C|nr:serine/threonine-protein kinase 16-like [Anneissia japonica]